MNQSPPRRCCTPGIHNGAANDGDKTKAIRFLLAGRGKDRETDRKMGKLHQTVSLSIGMQFIMQIPNTEEADSSGK